MAALGLALFAGPARAQATGILRGTVVDESTLRPIPNVQILTQPGPWSAVTDSMGTFRMAGIPEGLYAVLARRIGFEASGQANVRIVAGKATELELQLKELVIQLATVDAVVDPFPKDPSQGVGQFTYTAQEIRRTPGAAGDIFRAIETEPGVSSGTGGFSAFSVRGGGPRDNVILIDDIPFDKVTHLEGGAEADEAQGGRYGIFAPDLVQSADFRAGGFPAQYGGKNASLLALKLREGNTETGTFGGRFDLLGWEANYDGPSRIHGGTSLLISARHEDFERVLKLIGFGDRGHPEFTDLIFKSVTTLGKRNKISVLGIYAPESVVRTVSNVLEEADTNDTGLYDWHEKKGVVGVTWRLLAGDASIVQTSAYVQHYTRTNGAGAVYPDLPGTNGDPVASRTDVLVNHEAETTAGVRSVGTINIGRNTFILSAEAAQRRLDGGRSVAGTDTLYTFDQFDPRDQPDHYYLVVTPGTYDAGFALHANNLAGSASYQRSFGSDGSITLGGRFEHDGVSGQDNVVPRGSLTFPTVAGVSLNFAGGVYLQPTDLRDLAADPRNALLAPQRSVNVLAGVSTFLQPDVRFSVEAYYRSLTDLPVLQSRESGLELTTGTGHADGVDVTLVKRLSDRFFGQVSYSWAESKRDDHRGALVYNGDGNRPHSFNALAGYIINERWSVSGKFKIASGAPTDSILIHSDIFPGSGLVRYSREIVGHNAARLPDLQSLNLRVDYQARIGRTGIDAFLDVLNVYDRLNVVSERFVERKGTTFYDGVPIVPTFGLKLLF